MKRALAASFLAITAVAGCRPDGVDLAYVWNSGEQTAYRMTATATAQWEIGAPGEGRYRVEFDILERVLSTNEDGALVEVTMTPIKVEEQGMQSPGASERTFSLRLDDRGRVLEVVEVDGVAAADLAPDQLTFIGSYRPPLPLGPVGLRDTWTSEPSDDPASPSNRIAATGTLTRFLREDDADVAQIELTGNGRIEWATELTQSGADLDGSMTTRTTASLRVADGSLREATSETTGDFVVVIDGGDGEDETGRLELDLEVVVVRR